MRFLKHGFKVLTISACLLGGGLIASHSPVSAARPFDAQVQINERLVDFPDAQPFIDENGRMQVPVRFVSEQLGYEVTWNKEASDYKVTIENNDHDITFVTGYNEAYIGDQVIPMDTSAFVNDGRVYIPLRFLTEMADISLDWINSHRLAILQMDGNQYGPTNEAMSVKKVLKVKATAYTASPAENGKYGARDFLGNTLSLGTIAMDPKVIPLGSKVYIEGYDFNGLPTGGFTGIASDTGSAIKGNRIDIFVPVSAKDARTFGIQQVNVYVLK